MIQIPLTTCPNSACASKEQRVVVMIAGFRIQSLQELPDPKTAIAGETVRCLLIAGDQLLCLECGMMFLNVKECNPVEARLQGRIQKADINGSIRNLLR